MSFRHVQQRRKPASELADQLKATESRKPSVLNRFADRTLFIANEVKHSAFDNITDYNEWLQAHCDLATD
jgi:hypothetical protein